MPIPASQIIQAQKLLLAFSIGKYHVRGNLSPDCNDDDSIISGLNMLGEELQNTTVSLDFFSSVYNSAFEMFIVVTPDGKIKDVNHSAQDTLMYTPEQLEEKPVHFLFSKQFSGIFKEVKKSLRKENAVFSKEAVILSKKRKAIPVMLTCSKIFKRKVDFSGYLFCIKDISIEKKTEQRILNSIIEAQEQEQHRVSFDLHDSLGQEIVNAKTMLSLVSFEKNKLNRTSRNALKKGAETLVKALDQIHHICFNLRPTELESFGLCSTVKQLIENLQQQHPVSFHFDCPEKIKTGNSSLEITIYRVVQEFITNSIKHAKAKNIYIKLFFQGKLLNIELRDDGKGFKLNSSAYKGRGLNNIGTRVKAFKGTHRLISSPGKGTMLKAEFRITPKRRNRKKNL